MFSNKKTLLGDKICWPFTSVIAKVNGIGIDNLHLYLGSAPDKPNIYDFSTTYHEMYQDLAKKDKSLYTQNGILHMLDRNRRIKPRPERLVEN